MLNIGDKLGERYKIQSLVGTGGMASVYLAKDLILDRQVAVKVLRYNFNENTDAMRRFQREALSATQLTHPNIVGVYDVGEENGIQYIIMEYVQGKDLKEYIRERGPLSPRESIHIMRQILSAIQVAHQNRIIHRDIKPQNILIDRERTVKITDFGIAIALSETSLTQTNTLLGSVHYLSPEQARGGMATVRTDIYALGIVLFELLSGRVPFDGESAVSIALKHFQDELPSLTDMMPTIPQSLENVVLKATAKEPLDRYSSCIEMLEDLETVLDPSRVDEAKFQPSTFSGETKVITPLKDVSVVKPTPKLPEEIEKVTFDEDIPLPSGKGGKEKPEKKKRKKWPWLLGLLLLLSIIVAGVVFYNKALSPGQVEVPNVVDLPQEQATKILEEAGLKVGNVTNEVSDKVKSGNVISTDPNASTKVKQGSTVSLKISKGTNKVKVGDYKGKTFEEAKAELEKLGFTVSKKEENSDKVESGKVISQSISEGKEVLPSENPITLNVSIGKQTLTLSDLSNYSKTDAMNYARENKLEIKIEEENSETVEKDNVIRQQPAAGTTVSVGDTVTIVVSLGSSTRNLSKDVTIPYKAPSHSSSGSSQVTENRIQIYIMDANNDYSRVYKSFSITKNTTTTLNFTLNSSVKSGRFRIVRDGETIEEGTLP